MEEGTPATSGMISDLLRQSTLAALRRGEGGGGVGDLQTRTVEGPAPPTGGNASFIQGTEWQQREINAERAMQQAMLDEALQRGKVAAMSPERAAQLANPVPYNLQAVLTMMTPLQQAIRAKYADVKNKIQQQVTDPKQVAQLTRDADNAMEAELTDLQSAAIAAGTAHTAFPIR
jgi:hypothetical protein